jgi:hypothetical protein
VPPEVLSGVTRLLAAAWLALIACSAPAQDADSEASYKKQVGAFLDEWHDDAAHSRMAYFDKIAAHGVYIGTDKTERWTRDEFKAWAKPHFAKPSAWAFKAINRNVRMSPDRNFIWFDEQLATQMGLCQASGVIRRTDRGFEIEHYQLSLAVPNELVDQFTASIRKFESGSAAGK